MSTRDRIGWLLFTLSGVIFLAGGIVNGDPWSIVASIPWLVGCGLFMLMGNE